MLSEAQAWREIARRIDKRGLLGVGLCREVYQLWAERRIARDVEVAMEARIDSHFEHGRVVILIDWFDAEQYARDSRDVRILAALWMALEAEDEASSHLSGGARK